MSVCSAFDTAMPLSSLQRRKCPVTSMSPFTKDYKTKGKPQRPDAPRNARQTAFHFIAFFPLGDERMYRATAPPLAQPRSAANRVGDLPTRENRGKEEKKLRRKTKKKRKAFSSLFDQGIGALKRFGFASFSLSSVSFGAIDTNSTPRSPWREPLMWPRIGASFEQLAFRGEHFGDHVWRREYTGTKRSDARRAVARVGGRRRRAEDEGRRGRGGREERGGGDPARGSGPWSS